MTLLQLLLFPFTLLYKLITDFRNHLYNIGYKRSFRFETNVINVGNLTVGGTGKTPHVEYLIALLKPDYKIATLSRGYGRKTKGFILADETATAQSLGDEPLQFFRKFSSDITVTVCEDRAEAIPKILFERPATQVIILDDAFQHRPVQPDLNILLTDYKRLFYQDFPFPAGRLRESRYGAKRADAVIVTKCPADLDVREQRNISQKILKYTQKDTPVFFTSIRYQEPKGIFEQYDFKEVSQQKDFTLIALSGIAQPAIFEQYLKEKYKVSKHFTFADHHNYTAKDLQKVATFWQQHRNSALITTEKDYVKIAEPHFRPIFRNIPLFYLPMEITFLDKEAAFKRLILTHIKEFSVLD
jgi:tetraacyldisaccharide 4'-kinase